MKHTKLKNMTLLILLFIAGSVVVSVVKDNYKRNELIELEKEKLRLEIQIKKRDLNKLKNQDK